MSPWKIQAVSASTSSSRWTCSANTLSSSFANGNRHTIGGITSVMSRLRASDSNSEYTFSVDVRLRLLKVDASMIKWRPAKSFFFASIAGENGRAANSGQERR